MYYVEFISYFISFVIRAAKNGRDGAAFTVFLVGSEIVACAFVLCCVCEDFVIADFGASCGFSRPSTSKNAPKISFDFVLRWSECTSCELEWWPDRSATFFKMLEAE